MTFEMQHDNCVGFMKRKCLDDEVDDDDENAEDKRRCLTSGEASAAVEETVDLNDRGGSLDKRRGRRRKKMGIRRHKRIENGSSLRIQSQNSVAATCATVAVTVPETESIDLEISNIGSIDAAMSLHNASCETVVIDAPSISSMEAANRIVSHAQEKEKTEEDSFAQPTGNRLLENKITDKHITSMSSIGDLKPPYPIQETLKNGRTLKDSTTEHQVVAGKSFNETTTRPSTTCMTTFSDFCLAPRKGSSSAPDDTFKKPNSAKSASRERFIYGNYNRYYGYRSPELEADVRLACFPSSLFEAKTVLDIGCNVGHVTMLIARDWRPTRIVGVDIDRSLVAIAKKNIRHYVNDRVQKNCLKGSAVKGNVGSEASAERPTFPNNVLFMQGNYVLERDDLLDLQREEYDVILALSISKWIHLNWGDEGLKRTFRRIFRQLRPGGKLVLEPQEWSSYKRKKKLTDAIFKNYQSIRFFPQHFRSYLLSEEVGFSSCEMLGVPDSKSKGFRRPLLLFTKKDVAEITNAERSTCLQSMALKSDFDDEKLDSIVNRGSPVASPADACIDETASEGIAAVPVTERDAVLNGTNHIGIAYSLPSDTYALCGSIVTSSGRPVPEESNLCTVSSEMEASSSKDNRSLFTTASSQSIAEGDREDDADVSVSAAGFCPDSADRSFGDVDYKECSSPIVNSMDDWMPAVRTVCNGGLEL